MVVGERQRASRCSGDATDDGARPADGYLLADDGTNERFERIDTAGHTESGTTCHKRRQNGVATEGGVDRHGIGVEVEQPANSPDGRGEIPPIGEIERHANVRPTRLDDGLAGDDGDPVPVRQGE